MYVSHIISKITGLLLLICLSCKNLDNVEPSVTKDITEIKISEQSNYEGLLYSDLYDSIKFIKLESTPESLIGRIDKIIFAENKYYILDQVQSKSVFIFDAKGKFLGKVGKNGKGPGEYDEPNDIAYDPISRNILLYVSGQKSILSFDPTGKFLNKIKLDYWIKSFSVLNENVLALYFDYNRNINITSKSEYNLILINKNKKILYKSFKYDKNINFGLGGFHFFNKTNENLLVSPGYSNVIYKVTEKSVLPLYKINFGNKEIPKEYFAIESPQEFNKKLMISNYSFLNRYFDSPNYLLISFVQARKIYLCLYSKKTNKLKISNIFINDIFGLLDGGSIFGMYDDNVISYYEPSTIESIKKIYNSSFPDGVKLKMELKNYYESILEKYNENIKNDLRQSQKLVEKAIFKPTIQEKQFLNSIEPGDNPVLIIAKLKSF